MALLSGVSAKTTVVMQELLDIVQTLAKKIEHWKTLKVVKIKLLKHGIGELIMDELKPCPFCGGKALLSHDHAGIGASYIRCEKCGLESIRFLKSFEIASDDKAVEFWNRRVNDD